MKTIYTKWPGTDVLLLGLNVALLLLAIIWWPLRMLYSDSAYISWRLFQYGMMDFGHFRFSSLLTQFLPWLSLQAGADLKAFLICYSFSLQLPVFVLAWYAFRRKLHGTALACFMLCGVWTGSAWFIPVSEMYLAAVFALGWHAVYSRQGNKYSSALLFLLSAFSHSGILPALLFMAMLHILNNPFRRWWPISVCILLLTLTKLLVSDDYEHGFLAELMHPEQLQHSYLPGYLKRTLWNGSGAVLLLLYGITSWMYRKDLRKLLLHTVIGMLILLVLALLFQQGDSDQVLEKNLIPLCLFLSIPLIEAGNEGKSLTDKRVLFWIPVLFGAIQICAAQQWALNRHKQLRGLISFVQKNCPSGKLAITGNPEQVDQRLQAAWALPYETMMSSRLFTPETTGVSVKLMRQEQPDSTYKKALFSGAVFTPPLPIVELNKRGYNLSPKPYCLLDAQQCNW